MNRQTRERGDASRPNFVVIGAAKAGTTALYWYLSEHPQVYMSPLKETNYFAYEVDETGGLVYGDPELHSFPVRDWDSYLALFAEAGAARAVGEASPIYIECPHSARQIMSALGETKIICGLRNPVDRAYSDYQMYLRNRGRRLDPDRDLSLEAPWIQPDSHWMRIGMYHEMLSRYFEVFPRRSIHVYRFEELKVDSLRVVQDVYRFLNVDSRFRPDLKTPHNVGGVPSRMGIERLLTHKRLRTIAEPLVPRAWANAIRRLRTSNLQPAPPLPKEMRAAMNDVFREDIDRAEQLLGFDLSDWLGVDT